VTRRTSAPRGHPGHPPPGNWRRGYASDLNPVEGLLASFEGVELANLAADTVQKVTIAAEHGIRRIRGTRAPGLLVPTSLRLILAGPRLSTPATDHQVVSVAKSHARRAERN
jgi:hypothetical protein